MWFNLQGSHWQPTVFTSSGHVYWSRKHPLPVGCTVQTSCSRKSWRSFYLLKQNCNVVEGMWWWLVGRTLGIRLYVLPGTKKNHSRDLRWEERCSIIWYLARWRTISAWAKVADWVAHDLALRWSLVIKHDHKIEQCSSHRKSREWFFFLSRVVWCVVEMCSAEQQCFPWLERSFSDFRQFL